MANPRVRNRLFQTDRPKQELITFLMQLPVILSSSSARRGGGLRAERRGEKEREEKNPMVCDGVGVYKFFLKKVICIYVSILSRPRRKGEKRSQMDELESFDIYTARSPSLLLP